MSCMSMQMPFIDMLGGRFLAILLLSLSYGSHHISSFSIMWSKCLNIHAVRALHQSHGSMNHHVKHDHVTRLQFVHLRRARHS